MSEQDKKVMDGIDAAKGDHPELAEMLDLYRKIYEVQIRLKEGIPGNGAVVISPAVQRKPVDGRPALAFDSLSIDPDALRAAAVEIGDLMSDFDGHWEGAGDAVRATSSGDLLGLARGLYDGGSDEGLGTSEAMMYALRLALSPFIQQAAEAIAPSLDLSEWQEGSCPVCGAAPDLSLLSDEGGRRDLICSWCDTKWSYVRLKCPFCGNIDASQMPYYPSEDKVYRLYVCNACKHYLKTVDTREVHRVVIPKVERILTASLDVGAQQNGYVAD